MDHLFVLLSFCITFAAVPSVETLCWRIGAVDVPKDYRRMHTRPIPRGGGLAIFAGFFLSCLAMGGDRELFCLLGGGFLMLMLGLADDVLCLGAMGKLACQIAIGVATVSGGTGLEGLPLAGGVLWVVTLANAHNFIDGLDGLFAGTAAIESGSSALALLLLGGGGSVFPLLALGASCLAFRCYNRFPARIFAGDCGSATVGFLLGILSLDVFRRGTVLSGLSALFLFAYPLTDLAVAVVRRVLQGKSPFSSDRAHLHHRLRAVGLNQKQCVGVLICICASLGGVGVLLCAKTYLWAASLACLGAAVVLMGLRRAIFRMV